MCALALLAQGDPPARAVTSVAVMPLQARGKITKDVVAVLDQLVLSQLQASIGRKVRVVGKSDIDALLGFEKTKDAVGCSDTSCAAELAGALGVDSIITGTVGTLGKKSVLSLAWIQQRDGQPIARHSQDLGADEEAFDGGVRAAIATLTSGMGSGPAAAVAGSATDVTGWWSWDCCGGQYSGLIFLRQTGNQVKGLLTDFSGGSGGALEGTVDGASLRFIRRAPGIKLTQDFRLTLSPDGQSARGDFDSAGLVQMNRDNSRPAGTPGSGITGNYRWECCNNGYWGTLVLVQDKTNVYGILHDEKAGSAGLLEGTLVDDDLKLKRTMTRAANGWQTFALRRSGRGFTGNHFHANGSSGGTFTLEPTKD